ncbi:MAG TPA: VOC family protein [Pyrinomonadaceae bacterium]|jgi:catechol 2,3-dioxygenase-like lactoylglutathione lyase family enzyme
MQSEWPDHLPVVQVRVARPTDRLEEVVRFYRDALGLKQIGAFSGHAGYDGVMLGLPGRGYHLEFTRHEAGSPCPAPSRDNLLVLYVADKPALDKMVARLRAHGHEPVAPENPYWAGQGVTFADPDGWRVVLMNTAGI